MNTKPVIKGFMVDGVRAGYTFVCPGCGDRHAVYTNPKVHRTVWEFNGSLVLPTFEPSLLVVSGHYLNPEHCWCKFYQRPENRDDPIKFTCYRCHSFVRSGMIRFLDDCSHALAGKTVPLQPVS